MNSENLRTASLYINNQLLSRGLLRDGRTIEFDRPGDDDYELADTMGRVMSVVNDLILRRDRDAEHRESLSMTLRTLRADSLRQTDHLSRLQDNLTSANRQLALASAHDAALTAQLKAAESTIHKLQADAARTKKLVAETRAICATDVRRRDRQIDALKKAVAEAGRARGERKSAGITTIHVTGEVGGDEAGGVAEADVMDDGYDLRQETNAFLAQLAKGLSDDNETVLAVIRKTFASLKDMSGWGKDDDGDDAAACGKASSQSVTLPANPEDMLPDLEGVLSHLRTMLSNPAFVPIEDLQERDDEIARLRDGWVHMEVRWQEAVQLIDTWRRRMAADGRPVDMEELKMSLHLSPLRPRNVGATAVAEGEQFGLSTLQEEEEEEEEGEEEEVEGEHSSFAQRQGSPSPPESLHLVPADDYQSMMPEYEEGQEVVDDSDSESSIFQDDVDGDIDMDDLEVLEPNVEILQQSATSNMDDSPSTSLPPPPKITPLEETKRAGNRKPAHKTAEKSRKRSGQLIEDTASQAAKASLSPAQAAHGGGQSPQKKLKTSNDTLSEQPSSRPDSGIYTNSNSSLDEVLLLEPASESTASQASSKTTARSTRSATSAKKPSPAPAKPATRPTRAASQEKKETPARPPSRPRSTRATAPTASSSSRTARAKLEPPKPRAAAAAMPPPPRPNRSSNTNSPATQPQATPKAAKKPSPTDRNAPPSDTTVPTASTTTTSPPKTASRLPRSRLNASLLPTAQQSPITVAGIAAKLAASEREANAARVRAKLKAARLGKNNTHAAPSTAAPSAGDPRGDPVRTRAVRDASGASSASSGRDENGASGGVSITAERDEAAGSAASSVGDTHAHERRKEEVLPEATAPTPGKRKRDVRTRAARVASRRRSTLSPWELQSLIAGEVAPGTAEGEVEG